MSVINKMLRDLDRLLAEAGKVAQELERFEAALPPEDGPT